MDSLRAILLERDGIESTRVAQNSAKEQYVLRIPKRELPKLQAARRPGGPALVQAHIPPMMGYHVGL